MQHECKCAQAAASTTSHAVLDLGQDETGRRGLYQRLGADIGDVVVRQAGHANVTGRVDMF